MAKGNKENPLDLPSEETHGLSDGDSGLPVDTAATDTTKKTRTTLGMKGLANLPIPKTVHDKLVKSGKAVGLTAEEFFSQHYLDDFTALLDGHLQKDGASIASLRDRLSAALQAKVDATLGEAGV